MNLVEDKDVLQHLLHLEAEASALVDDAQAEADRRISEGERRNRAGHDEAYGAEVSVLEAVHVKEIEALREDYRRQLETYKAALNAKPVNQAAFSVLAEKFLLGGK